MTNDLDELIKAKDLICKIFMTNWGWELGVVLPKFEIHFPWHVQPSYNTHGCNGDQWHVEFDPSIFNIEYF
jgi:hypothetical protein